MYQQRPLDRDCFEQILAAASLLQQIQRRAIYHGSHADADRFQLKDLVNIQQAIQTGTLPLEAAITSIAALALEMVPAQGAGAWLFAGEGFVYRAGAGTASDDERMRNAVLSKLADSEQSTNPQSSICAAPSPIKSLLVTPIYQGPAIAGALALFSESENCFSDRDETSARLLTGLLSQALDKAANARFKHTVTLERAVVLHVIETLVPSLEKLVEMGEHRGGRLASPLNFVAANESEEESNAAVRSGGITLPFAVEDRKGAGACPLVYQSDEVRETWPVPLTEDAVTVVPVALASTPIDESVSRIGTTSTLAISPTQIEQHTPAREAKSVAIEEHTEPPMTDMGEVSHSNFSPIAGGKSISTLRVNLRSVYRRWCLLWGWSLKMVAAVWNRIERYESKCKYLIASNSLVTKNRAGVAIALLMALVFLVVKREAPKVQPKSAGTARALSVLANRLNRVAAPVADGSHKRVTDPPTSAALGELSRFEIPGLLRQARYGDDAAAFTIGMAYETGRGVRQSCEEAADWVKRAATGGNAAAQYNLGLRYRDGDGVKANSEESERWLRKAVAREYPEAQKALESLASNQRGAAATAIAQK